MSIILSEDWPLKILSGGMARIGALSESLERLLFKGHHRLLHLNTTAVVSLEIASAHATMRLISRDNAHTGHV
jgi:hypothetical protein